MEPTISTPPPAPAEDSIAASASSTDTIAAIATPPGIGGIGIVRISGSAAFAVGQAMFRPHRASSKGTVAPSLSHKLTYGNVIDPASGEVIDEVLVAFLRAPHTYTREDIVEFQAHGAPLVLGRILEVALGCGARAARPGELTLRAFLNGRLDLAQAEAVQALITAETEATRRMALRQLQGDFSARVTEARAAALAALVQIEATIDFPEEEVPVPDVAALVEQIHSGRAVVDRLLRGAERGHVLREGLRVVIVGRPNVGKSSLLNALLQADRAIVTPIPGTTRDTIEESAQFGDLHMHLVDTAGLTESDDPIERIGVERSRAAARTADVVLFVLDGSAPLTDLDQRAANDLRSLLATDMPPTRDANAQAAPSTTTSPGATIPVVLVVNKSDLTQRMRHSDAAALWAGAPLVATSSRNHAGVAPLVETLQSLALGGNTTTDDALVSSARHRDALRRADEHLAAAADTLGSGIPLEFAAIDLRAALDALGEITGETISADLLDQIFAEFCIGK